MSQRSRRNFPDSARFYPQPGAAVRQDRRRFRQHRARERRRVDQVRDAHRVALRPHGIRATHYDPIGAPGLFW